MGPRGRRAAIVATIVVVSMLGGRRRWSPAPVAGDESALQPTRQPANRGIERKVDRLLRQMTVDEKLQQVQLLSDGQITDDGRAEGRRRRVQPHRPGQDRPLPARRRRAVAAAHPDPVRLRHDPRLPHDLPGAAGRGEQLRPGGGDRRRHDLRARVGRGRHQADLRPMVDVSHEPRWGRIVEGSGEDPYLGSVFAAARVRAAQGDDYAAPDKVVTSVKHFAAYGAARGRPRLQHDRHVRAAAAQPLPAAVQGRDRRGLPTRSCARSTPSTASPGCANPHIETDILKKRVGLRRLHRERLHRGRRAARLPAARTRTRARAATASRPTDRGAARPALNAGTDSEMVSTNIRDYGKQLLVAAPDLDGAPRRRRAPDPAREVPRRAVRPSLRRPDQGRRSGQLR